MSRKLLGIVFATALTLSLMYGSALAQDATPEGASEEMECVESTAEDNKATLEAYIEAIVAGDAETAHALLNDDFVHDLSVEGAEVPNEPGNEDELAGIDTVAETNLQILQIIAEGDWAAIEFSFDISGAEIEGADPETSVTARSIALVRFECGGIAEALIEFDALGVLQAFGWEIVAPGEMEEE